MNIFFLDRDPITAAEYHCDKHVVKMILETAQLLSTAHLDDMLIAIITAMQKLTLQGGRPKCHFGGTPISSLSEKNS